MNIPRYVDTFEEEEQVDLDVVKENLVSIKTELSEVEAQMVLLEACVLVIVGIIVRHFLKKDGNHE